MPLISEKTKENAEKCRNCAFLKLRDSRLDKNSVLYDQAIITVEAVYRASCNMCPYSKDFVKIYGVKPYEYFKRESDL